MIDLLHLINTHVPHTMNISTIKRLPNLLITLGSSSCWLSVSFTTKHKNNSNHKEIKHLYLIHRTLFAVFVYFLKNHILASYYSLKQMIIHSFLTLVRTIILVQLTKFITS